MPVYLTTSSNFPLYTRYLILYLLFYLLWELYTSLRERERERERERGGGGGGVLTVLYLSFRLMKWDEYTLDLGLLSTNLFHQRYHDCPKYSGETTYLKLANLSLLSMNALRDYFVTNDLVPNPSIVIDSWSFACFILRNTIACELRICLPQQLIGHFPSLNLE